MPYKQSHCRQPRGPGQVLRPGELRGCAPAKCSVLQPLAVTPTAAAEGQLFSPMCSAYLTVLRTAMVDDKELVS